MKRLLKSLISSALILAAFFSFESSSFAESAAEVNSETVYAEAGEYTEIPVFIKNNPGLMGYKIIISCDKNVFVPVKVTQGTAISGGIFNDSIGTSKNNEFTVLWSGTSNACDDGLLFTVGFNTASDAKGKQTIKISYSSDDTFNENWHDVSLKCQDAVVDFGGEAEPVQYTFFDRIISIFRMIIDFLKGIFM